MALTLLDEPPSPTPILALICEQLRPLMQKDDILSGSSEAVSVRLAEQLPEGKHWGVARVRIDWDGTIQSEAFQSISPVGFERLEAIRVIMRGHAPDLHQTAVAIRQWVALFDE